MKKNMVMNCLSIVLCIVTLYINGYKEEYKALGMVCILAMGVIAVFKEKLSKKEK